MRIKSGVSMQIDRARVVFKRLGPERYARKLEDRIPEVRALLRTNKCDKEIARELGVQSATLVRFCRSRGICDLAERRKLLKFMGVWERSDG